MNERAVIPWRSLSKDTKLARVKELTERGLTCSQIAAEFNRGVPHYYQITRNAIVGFWHRNGIKSKSEQAVRGGFTPESQAKAQATREANRISATRSAEVRTSLGKRTGNFIARCSIAARKARAGEEKPWLVPIPAADRIAGQAVPMMDIRAFECRAVVDGKDEHGLAMMCGASVHHPDSAWCADHAKRYTRPVEPRGRV